MMIRVQFVLLYLVRISGADDPLGKPLTHSWVDLAHLRPLADSISLLLEVVARLNRPQSRGRPDGQRREGNVGSALGDKRAAFLLSVLEERLRHLDGVNTALVREGGVGLVGVFLRCGPRADEEGLARLDVQVRQVEYDSVGDVVEADVVVEKRLPCVDHPDVVELFLVHDLEYGDLHLYPLEIELGSLIGIHSVELRSAC